MWVGILLWVTKLTEVCECLAVYIGAQLQHGIVHAHITSNYGEPFPLVSLLSNCIRAYKNFGIDLVALPGTNGTPFCDE